MAHWFFTACACRTEPPPGPGRAEGAAVVAVRLARHRRGGAGGGVAGLTPKFFPDGLDFPAAVALDWVDWARLAGP